MGAGGIARQEVAADELGVDVVAKVAVVILRDTPLAARRRRLAHPAAGDLPQANALLGIVDPIVERGHEAIEAVFAVAGGIFANDRPLAALEARGDPA